MNWEDFESEIKILSQKINYRPDMIIGVVRGGIIPARLLSKYLQVKKMFCLNVQKISGEREIITEIKENLENKNILLVEDMLETGKSLIAVKEYLESKGAKVKTACLYIMPISEIKPDFYIKEINQIEKFPWD
ncbi:hypothetical protein HYT24_01110 [Candidatus Pacearchaeota archaeon]|nr:hypothetical protein [Candidatus Pacearchaeota archaeon]